MGIRALGVVKGVVDLRLQIYMMLKAFAQPYVTPTTSSALPFPLRRLRPQDAHCNHISIGGSLFILDKSNQGTPRNNILLDHHPSMMHAFSS